MPSDLLAIDDSNFAAFVANPSSETGSVSVLVLYTSPLKVELYLDGALQITANEQSFLHFEHSQANNAAIAAEAKEEEVDRHNGKTVVDYGEDGKRLLFVDDNWVL